MTTEYFLPIFISWLLIAAVVGASVVVVAYEEKEDERKKRARKKARREAQKSARRIAELKRQIESREAELALYEANRAFYKDVHARKVIFEEVKTGEDGKLIAVKGRVG